MSEAQVIRCDALIVGGGIAGVAIAERMAREARRQNKSARIVLVERRDELGTGSSGSLEGWHHTGTLYSKYYDPLFFINCVNAFEDLYNWYFFDPMFALGKEHCNLKKIDRVLPQPQHEFNDRKGNWFLRPIAYILSLDAESTESSYDTRYISDWKETCDRIKHLAAWTFFGSDFRNTFGSCQVPYVGKDFPLRPSEGRKGAAFTSILFDDIKTAYSKKKVREALNFASKFQSSLLSKRNFEVLLSPDSVMDTRQILHDLATMAVDHGVEILYGYELEPKSVHISRYWNSRRITGVTLRNTEKPDNTLHVVADQYVFGLGLGFEENEMLRDRLDVRVKVEKRLSVMVVAEPALSDQSFVVMDSENDFNHIYRPWNDKNGGYSIIADSNGLSPDASLDQIAEADQELIRKAEMYFGVKRIKDRGRTMFRYVCTKTEFPSEEGKRRYYSFWFGPKYEWDRGKWLTEKVNDRKKTQEDIRNYVNDRGQSVLADDIRESMWALKKRIHFTLQRIASKSKNGQECAESLADLVKYRNEAIECLQANIKSERGEQPNFLCVVPGKFSLFPTLAHQVYQEMEVRGFFENLSSDVPKRESKKTEVKVALPHAERILSELKKQKSKV